MSTSRVPATSTPERSGARPVSQPQDHSEREADRAADVVARGGSVTGWSFSSVAASAPGPVQRQEAGKGKSEDEKHKEAAKKAGEAALETDAGKALKERVLADPVVQGVTSPYVLVPAIAGGVAGLAATGKELPIQPPEIPLDKITPGLSGKLTYEGPVNAPTFVGLTITYKEQGPKGRKSSDKDAVAADIARLRAQQQMFKPQSEKAAEKKAEAEMVQAWITSGAGLTFPLTPAPKREESKKAEELTPVQPAPASAGATMATHANVDAALSTPGHPLDSATRRSMEARFGYDFSRVRVHDDARAAATASSIDAAAFTVGENIVFGGGGYDTSRPAGRRLLAHELAHVVQQREKGRAAGTLPALPRDSLGPRDQAAGKGQSKGVTEVGSTLGLPIQRQVCTPDAAGQGVESVIDYEAQVCRPPTAEERTLTVPESSAVDGDFWVVPNVRRQRLTPILDDEDTGVVVAFRYSSGGYYEIFDLDGTLVDVGEPGLESPLIDPIDLIGGIFSIGRGLARAGTRAAVRGAAGRAGGAAVAGAGLRASVSLLSRRAATAARAAYRAIRFRGALQFTGTTAARMADPARRVPHHILKLAIQNGQRTADPQGVAGAFRYTIQMFRNGREYALEVVIRESDRTVLHFLYR